MLSFKKIINHKIFDQHHPAIGPCQITLETKNLSWSYGPIPVLKEVNFTIQSGEKVAIRGTNGSGKTTLLRILATLLKPVSGEVFINGLNAEESLYAARKIIGWMPSNDDGFYPRLTGRENLQLFSALRRIKSQVIGQFISDWNHILPIERALVTPFYLCSTGMKHSLLLCRALLHSPDILLLDEPTRSLDESSRQKFYDFIESYAKEKIVLFATHSRDEASLMAMRQLTIRNGIVYDDTF